MKRIVAELKRRKYKVWFDLENMKGSVMDAMSEAVEGAELMLYGVSEKYKESANCRLELNYGVQEEVDLVPLMMQKAYKAKGWRKSQHQVYCVLNYIVVTWLTRAHYVASRSDTWAELVVRFLSRGCAHRSEVYRPDGPAS